MPTSQKKDPKELLPTRNYKKINHEIFAAHLAQQPWEELAQLSVNEMAQQFGELFLEVLDLHAPVRMVGKRTRETPRPSKELQRLRRQRDNARSKGQKSKLRELRRQCTKLSQLEAQNHVKQRISRGPNEVWRFIKEITGTESSSAGTIRQQQQALSSQRAADTFNDFFLSKIQNIRDNIGVTTTDPLSGARRRAQRLNIRDCNSFAFCTVTEETIVRIIRALRGSRCPDAFGISPAALKIAPEIVSLPLTWIINACIREGTFPEIWKQARVLPVHKKGAKDNVQNYRPISILPAASKVLEEVLRCQLVNHIEMERILPESQYGFRPGYSTLHAAGAAYHDWSKAKFSGQNCGALLFDLSAAFDTLDASLLVKKLHIYGVAKQSKDIILSFLTGRKQRVEYRGGISQYTDVLCGSPQGSILSPVLFLLLVADIEEWTTEGFFLGYADDTSYFAIANSKGKVRQILQRGAKGILDFMEATMLSVNPEKTKFLMFGKGKEDPITVGDAKIPESKAECLLGFTFNKSLTWVNHMEKLENDLRKKIGLLRRLSWQVPRDVALSLIEPIFMSKLRYGAELTTNAMDPNDINSKKLRVLHSAAMKAAARIPPRQHTDYEELLKTTRQTSIASVIARSTCRLAWQCSLNWHTHPLTGGRVQNHLNNRETRQGKRCFPPQNPKNSLVSKVVEYWEGLPPEIQTSKSENSVKSKLKKLFT